MRNTMRAVSAMLVAFLSLVSMAACGESSSGASGGSKSGSSAVTFTQAIENHKLWFLVEPGTADDDSVGFPGLSKDGEIDSVWVRTGGANGQYQWDTYSTSLTFQDINGKTDDEIISSLGKSGEKASGTTRTYVTTDPTGNNAQTEFIASQLTYDQRCRGGNSVLYDGVCYPQGGDFLYPETLGGMPLTHTAQIYDMYFQGLESSEISTPGEDYYDTQFFVTRVDADDPGIVMDSPKDGAVTVVG